MPNRTLVSLLCAASGICAASVFAESKSDFINQITGVYKASHKIASHQGASAGSEHAAVNVEDVLEIVPYKNEAAYFRIILTFDNGHMCSLFGIAAPTGAKSLQYNGPSDAKGDQCILSMKFDSSGILFFDQDAMCQRISCSEHGSYGDINHAGKTGFELNQKHEIPYLASLIQSKEYKKAVSAYENRSDN